MNPPIIEVTAHDDGATDDRIQVSYKVRPCNFRPVHYGIIMATLMKYVADMIAQENPKVDAEIVLHEIVRHTLAAIDEKDETQEPMRRLN